MKLSLAEGEVYRIKGELKVLEKEQHEQRQRWPEVTCRGRTGAQVVFEGSLRARRLRLSALQESYNAAAAAYHERLTQKRV